MPKSSGNSGYELQPLKGGGILFTTSPYRREEEHDPKGEERRGVAVPSRSDESAGKI